MCAAKDAGPSVVSAETRKISIDVSRDLLNPSATRSPAKRARDQNIAAVLELLAEIWPKCFCVYEQRRRPLKIGVHRDILAVLDGAVTPAELSRALRIYTGTGYYRKRLRAGAVRIDLNGDPAGVVTKKEEPAPADPGIKPGGIRDRAMRAVSDARRTDALADTTQPKETKPRRLGLADLRKAALQRKQVAP